MDVIGKITGQVCHRSVEQEAATVKLSTHPANRRLIGKFAALQLYDEFVCDEFFLRKIEVALYYKHKI